VLEMAWALVWVRASVRVWVRVWWSVAVLPTLRHTGCRARQMQGTNRHDWRRDTGRHRH
jgi:hypothetical protein